MNLLKEMLIEVCKHEINNTEFENSILKIVEMKCYQTLKKIKEIVEDDTLDDKECFDRIEKIVCSFEEIGSGGGFRHDF